MLRLPNAIKFHAKLAPHIDLPNGAAAVEGCLLTQFWLAHHILPGHVY